MNKLTPTDYVNAFQRAYPNMTVTVNGPNKKGFYAVSLNGEKGDLRMTSQDLAEATLLLQSRGERSLRNSIPPVTNKLGLVARYKE
jgi:hypothetical protein